MILPLKVSVFILDAVSPEFFGKSCASILKQKGK